MDERVVIFGGQENLSSLLRQVSREHPAAIFVVRTAMRFLKAARNG